MKYGFRSLMAFIGLAALVLGLFVVGVAQSQVISGDLVGTILDKSGAAVPNATVNVENADTGIKYTTTANGTGEYRFANLPIGYYNVSATAAGFATTTVNKFHIELNKATTLQITLEVTGTTTSIEVVGGVAALDTTTAQLSSTFESKQAENLPLAGTSGVLNLSLLTSGVVSSGGVGAGSGPAVGGQRPRNNNFTIEGVDNNDKSVTGPLYNVPNDAVAEFSLLQNNFGAEYGHSSGGQFNTLVKSGTNVFHGMAYVYNENRNYDAMDTLQKAAGDTQPPRYDNNRYGGNVGGPILKNKLFFFVNYEYNPVGSSGVPGAACAPDAAGWQTIDNTSGLSATNVSIFKQYVPVGTQGQTAANGCTNVPFGNTTISTQGLSFPIPSYSNTKNLVTSGDWNISSKDQLRARYLWSNFAGLDTSASLPVFFTTLPVKDYVVTINEYHQFTSNVQNEFRFGFNRSYAVYSVGSQKFPGLDAFPNLTYDDLNFLNLGPDPNAPQGGIQNTYQAADAVSWTKGRHSMKYGFEARKIISPQYFTQRVRGDYEYSSLHQYLVDGQPDSFAERSIGSSPYYGDQTAWYFYAQDNWRIRPNFTLNLGVRYEYTTIPYTQRLQSLNAIASVPGLVDFREPTAAKNNWAPRIGFAWSPGTSGRTSVRAGFGMAYDVLYDNLGILSAPPELQQTTDCNTIGTPPGQGGYYCDGVNNPKYVNGFLAGGGLPSTGNTTFPDQASAAAVTGSYVPVDQKSPKSIDWTLGVQHAFANDYTVEVRYVGTRGIHLPAQIRLNRQPKTTSTIFLPTYLQNPGQAALDALPYTLAEIQARSSFVPAWAAGNFTSSNVVSFEPWAASSYNGMAAQLTKKYSHGLQYVASYTFSKTIDNATADVFSTVIAPRRAQDWLNLPADRSNSILDHRHRFSLALVYDVTAFKEKNWLLKNVVSNWTVAPIYIYQSGQWGTAQNAVDTNLNGDNAGDRPVFNPGGVSGTGTGVTALHNSAGATVAYLADNPNAQYIIAGAGARSNTGRSTLQLNAINNIDFNVTKRLNITERYSVQFGAYMYNIFNHAQYVGGYLNDVASIGFTGTERSMLIPNNPNFNNPSAVFSSNPRSMILNFKFIF
jgi:hypothetical protein